MNITEYRLSIRVPDLPRGDYLVSWSERHGVKRYIAVKRAKIAGTALGVGDVYEADIDTVAPALRTGLLLPEELYHKSAEYYKKQKYLNQVLSLLDTEASKAAAKYNSAAALLAGIEASIVSARMKLEQAGIDKREAEKRLETALESAP